MYLKIQYNNNIKPYTLTNNYNKPYIKVNGSILPLTTNTTNGIHIIVSTNNTTYRPLEYNSMSTSDTYYTSGIQSNGLSSTTALTRSSTSRTEYLTRSSTSSTVYDTRSSTSATIYDTRVSTSGTSYLTIGSAGDVYCYNSVYVYNGPRNGGAYTTYMTSLYSCNKITGITSQSKTFGVLCSIAPVTIYSTYETTYYYGSGSTSNTRTMQSMYIGINAYGAAGIWSGRTIAGDVSSFKSSNFTHRESYTTSDYDYASYGASYSTIVFSYNIVTQTTGTSYLTRSSTSATRYLTRSSTSNTRYLTRSSTYSTVYYTCSSTSGYSGVSSSSSQSSGWL